MNYHLLYLIKYHPYSVPHAHHQEKDEWHKNGQIVCQNKCERGLCEWKGVCEVFEANPIIHYVIVHINGYACAKNKIALRREMMETFFILRMLV